MITQRVHVQFVKLATYNGIPITIDFVSKVTQSRSVAYEKVIEPFSLSPINGKVKPVRDSASSQVALLFHNQHSSSLSLARFANIFAQAVQQGLNKLI
jgi:hypothetical protein